MEFPQGVHVSVGSPLLIVTGVFLMLQATRMWVSRFLALPRSHSLSCGLAAGTAWVAVCAAYWAAFEPVPSARLTFALAWACTVAVLLSRRVSGLLDRVPLFWRVGVASCGFAAWPTTWRLLLRQRELIPLDWYASEWKSIAVMGLTALLVLTPAIVCGCLLCPALAPQRGVSANHEQTMSRRLAFWLGVALSWAVLPSTLFVRVSADQILTGVAGCLLLGAGVSLFLRGDRVAQSPQATAVPRPTPADQLALSPSVTGYPLVVLILNALLLGYSLEAANRTAEQLVLETLPLKFIGWAGCLLGVVTGMSFRLRGHETRQSVRRSLWFTAAAGTSVLVLYPLWIRMGLWSSSSLSAMPAIMAAKGFIVAGILSPLGLAAGLLLGCTPRRGWLLCLMGVGYALNTWASGPLAESQLLVACLCVGLLFTLWPLETWQQFARERRVNRLAGSLAMCGCLIAMAWGCLGWLNPARSAAVLFHGDSFVAAGRGYDLLTIEQAYRTRWLKTIEGENGVWTVWRHHANQLVVRRNGVPSGQMSIDTTLGPQNFWSVITAALPVVTHPQTDHVLCLGTPGLVEINTILGFPIQTLTCVEADRDARSIIEFQASLTEATSRLNDSRIEWVDATPMQFAASAANRQFDVIVCPESTAIPMRSQPRLTREFYTRMSHHLSDTGIFCQRINVEDLGAAPICDLMQCLQASFAQSSIVTTVGTELLLLGSNSREPLFDPSLIARLETPHMRRLCATVGGDWSMLAQLACIPSHQVEQMLARVPGSSNSCGNARFLLTVGSETLRWGPKWKEKLNLFANRAELVLKEAKLKETDEQTVARRILDAQERTRILTQTADDEWSYRTVLRDALKSRPRTTIQRVNKEIRQTLTADDKRRKEYLVALGKAARETKPSLAAIERIETFAEPYDPLVTDFVHFEVANLMQRAQDSDPAREYRHWMYCIAYAPEGDRSIRPVAAAMNLLKDHPEIEPDPAWRWDQYNLLLDVMRTRWSNRWQSGTPSKYDEADLQHSIEAVNGTLSAMNDLQPQAGLDRNAWQVQRRVWDESLVSPIRSRQGQVDTKSEMLQAVRQEWMRRNSELSEAKPTVPAAESK